MPRRTAERQADALEQPEQVELGLGLHFVEHFVGREIVDPDDQVVAQRAKVRGEPREHVVSHRSESASVGDLALIDIACL